MRSGPRPWRYPWRRCGGYCRCRRRRWCYSTAQPIHRHGITGTSSVDGDFGYYQHNRLPGRKVKRKWLRWVRAVAFVCEVVGADVGRIKATQVGSRKDEVGACTSRVDIDVDALGRTERVTEAIGIVMVLLSVTEWPRACLECVTGAGNTRPEKSIDLRRIAGVDNSVDHNWRARRGCR